MRYKKNTGTVNIGTLLMLWYLDQTTCFSLLILCCHYKARPEVVPHHLFHCSGKYETTGNRSLICFIDGKIYFNFVMNLSLILIAIIIFEKADKSSQTYTTFQNKNQRHRLTGWLMENINQEMFKASILLWLLYLILLLSKFNRQFSYQRKIHKTKAKLF